MKCRLCDRPTVAGAGKLCADCAKALRRARGASAALRKLPLSQPNAAEAEAAPAITLTVAPPVAAVPHSNRRIAWVAVGLVAIALAYFVAQRELAGPRNAEALTLDRAPPPSTERPNVEPVPVAARLEEPSWTDAANPVNGPGGSANVPTATDVGAVKAPAVAAGAKTGTRTSKSANQDSKPMPPPLAFENDTTSREPEPPQQLAPVSVPTPAQPVDGAQVLASAMEKCGKESLVSKFFCEQKTYIQYCEDKWEKDPRCMRKTTER